MGARGLWMDMLCIMHQSDPYGFLMINRAQIDSKTLAKLVGASATKVDVWLHELETGGVFSRDGSNAIYSRRMIRDEEIRRARAEGGHLGGNPTLKDKAKVGDKVNLDANLRPTPSSSSSSSSSSSVHTKGVKVPESYQTPEVSEALDRFSEYYRQKKGEPFDAFMRQATLERAFGLGWTAKKLCECVTFSISKGWLSIYEESARPTVANAKGPAQADYPQLDTRRKGAAK